MAKVDERHESKVMATSCWLRELSMEEKSTNGQARLTNQNDRLTTTKTFSAGI